MRRRHAGIATFVAKTIASGASLEDVAVRSVLARKDCCPEFGAGQLHDCNESRRVDPDSEVGAAARAMSVDWCDVRAHAGVLDRMVRAATLGDFRRELPVVHPLLTLLVAKVEML